MSNRKVPMIMYHEVVCYSPDAHHASLIQPVGIDNVNVLPYGLGHSAGVDNRDSILL